MASQKEIITASANKLSQFRLPRWNELPDLDIYMDQLISLISRYFKDYPGYEEKSLTSSMVNNYVKQGTMPSPVSKKYNRVHLASLIVINILKTSIPIARVGELISESLRSDKSPAEQYDLFCDSFEYACNEAAQAAVKSDDDLSGTITKAALRASAEQSLSLDMIKNRE